MSPLPPRLVDRLAQRRIRTRAARPTVSGGERPSGTAGSGMEFVEHRPYQPGDDLRHLDRHAYARFRAPYVKRFAADRGLAVAILVDMSSSMEFGRPSKSRVATLLAAGIACAALAGGDQVQVGAFAGGANIEWSRPAMGIARLGDVVAGLERGVELGATDLLRVAEEARKALAGPGLVVVASDWWSDDIADAVRIFTGGGREVVAVHVLSRDEEEPEVAGTGPLRLEEAETGRVLEVSVDEGVHAAYRTALERWRKDLRSAVEAVGGRYLPVRTDEVVEKVLLERWLEEGFLA